MEVTTAGISAFQQSQVMDKVGTRVARIALDQAQSQGDAAVGLLKAAAEVARAVTGPAPGEARENGLGGRMDLRA